MPAAIVFAAGREETPVPLRCWLYIEGLVFALGLSRERPNFTLCWMVVSGRFRFALWSAHERLGFNLCLLVVADRFRFET